MRQMFISFKIIYYYGSIKSLSLQRAFLGCFFDTDSAIFRCSTTIEPILLQEEVKRGRVVGRNTRPKGDKENTLGTILSAVLSHLRIFYR